MRRAVLVLLAAAPMMGAVDPDALTPQTGAGVI
jgi:hypothetical protein